MRKFILLVILGAYGTACNTSREKVTFSSFEQAKKHTLRYDQPAVDFFEGALLGNGGLGAVVTTRPDGIMIYFGHNNVWDIRIAEKYKKEIGTFNYVFNKVSQIPDTLKVLTDDPWYKKYSAMAAENYRQPYPRPFPCGSVLLGFDRREAELLGHSLDISNGLCEVYLLNSKKEKIKLQLFTDMQEDKLWMQLVDEQGNEVPNIFNRMRVMQDPSTPAEFPKYTSTELLPEGTLSFRQVLPYQEPKVYDTSKGHPKDKALRLTAAANVPLKKTSRINWDGNPEDMKALEAAFEQGSGFVASVSLEEGMDTAVSARPVAAQPAPGLFASARAASDSVWKAYWEKSGVRLSDSFLEETWYRNLYFFNCAAKDGATTPGLFANWSFNKIGTAWHGDYHMNYNTQQPFWMTFSSNHLEKNLPYVNLIEFLMDVSRRWAKEYYNLPGAYFPHSAYPVDMTMNPYPVPHWGWEICETPWSVQGLWWHYLYSADTTYLKDRAYTPIREAVEFLVAYMKRPEARGGPRWQDDKYHIFPTIPPELYALRPGFKYNYDCNVDLTLTKFVFKAFEEMVATLKTEATDGPLLSDVKDILAHYPEYPTAVSEQYGKVLVSVPGEHDKVVYNVPSPLMNVFPGEDAGLHSDSATFQLLKNTYYNQQNEGGNDLVFINLQAARIGLLDIDRFKRQVKYSQLPNGTAMDKVMQVHGRYSDHTRYDYMGDMGIWFENFALPVVINECLMQSYNGEIRLFPNWDLRQDAEFRQLRAVGAFLVSASVKNGAVKASVYAEKGGRLRIHSPWGAKGKIYQNGSSRNIETALVEIDTQPGETITLEP
ncbi:glycosyl hydrolase family 95 catalytic domain-containing protein [Chitinophaga alhagiae]|uniref:glycosyl hydrolase family 95 catalytic domain-containing protein n=1 Tax=Chitinophaga alhagiae TaxID=2203219 RepID=UPI000E5B0EF0|nr:glycoside hydrolase N-terminal domain-containing protein [Chitinophaga alhagiae]